MLYKILLIYIIHTLIHLHAFGSYANTTFAFVLYRTYNLSPSARACPLAGREAPAEGRRPEGEGANIDRRLVPYHGKSRRIQSRIEFIPSLGAKRRPQAEGLRARVLISTGV